jgi:hypothetical protein
MDSEYIGTANQTCICPDCGKEAAIEDVEMINHDTLPIQIPVGRCWSCGFVWSGHKAELIVEQFMQAREERNG